MQPAHSSKGSEQTLESLFKAKYPWLLRWALHFAHNDAAAAEDLVQEAFVRVLLLKNTVVDLNDIDPLLYAHLRYAYLTERRRGRNYAFQSLSTAEFDTLSISLRSSSPSDQIEVQNEVRRILSFSLWRRRSAKFANMFLLRFFHELSHEEIASICLVSRHAVDSALLRAREEVSSYLSDPQRIEIAGRGAPPDFRPINLAIPSYEFQGETMAMIFGSVMGPCLDTARLERCYGALNLRPLDVDQLAHIVCCRRCLEKVARLSRTKPPDSGSSGTSKMLARRSGRPVAVERPEKASLARIVAAGERRMREIYGHRPSELVVALNGQIVAVRDIGSTRSILKIESHRQENLDMVELFSGQGVLMALLPIPRCWPQVNPRLKHEVVLSGERSLGIDVEFAIDGAVVEVSYIDPHFTSASAEEDTDEAPFERVQIVDEPHPEPGEAGIFLPPADSGNASTWNRLKERFKDLLGAGVRLQAAMLTTAVIILAALWIFIRPSDQSAQASDLLRNTVRSERRVLTTFGAGVVHQRVEIRSGGKSIRRELYRDAEGRSRPSHSTDKADERDLKQQLAQAGLDWDDPLSPTDFDAWRERIDRERDHVEPVGEGFLRLTTATGSGPLSRESITVRISDLHTIDRTVTFRNQETIEVAEVSYELEPWSPSNEKFFQPPARQPLAATPSPAPISAPGIVSDDELDLAGLSVLLALQDLHADAERLDVSRSATGIVVSGVVESEARKAEIAKRLYSIPHAISQIRSYSDLNSSAAPATQSVLAVSAVSEDSPLDLYCSIRKIDRDACRTLAHRILSSSASLAREQMRLTELRNDYPRSRSLSPVAGKLLNQLTQTHIDHLAASVLGLEQALHTLDPDIQPSAAEPSSPADLRSLVEESRSLTRELVYASGAKDRPPLDIIRELFGSAQRIQAVLPRAEQLTANQTSR